MKKLITLSAGVQKEMTYEDILVQFKQMIDGYAYRTVEKCLFNAPEEEEVRQELLIQTWIAFKKYDGRGAFSTYLVPRLKHGVHKATSKLYAKKRIHKKGFVSLDEPVNESEGEMNLANMIGEDDFDLTSYEFRELMSHLDKKLDQSEKVMLKTLMDRNDFSVQDLADELGMSRQGANKKLNKFVEKMQYIMRYTGYVTC